MYRHKTLDGHDPILREQMQLQSYSEQHTGTPTIVLSDVWSCSKGYGSPWISWQEESQNQKQFFFQVLEPYYDYDLVTMSRNGISQWNWARSLDLLRGKKAQTYKIVNFNRENLKFWKRYFKRRQQNNSAPRRIMETGMAILPSWCRKIWHFRHTLSMWQRNNSTRASTNWSW